MLRRLAYHCEQVIGAANKHFLFRNSTASFSSSSSSPRKSCSIHNYYLRKSRKWPIQPHKTQWHEIFAFQLAKQSFKRSIRKSKSHLLSDLIASFSAYETNPNPQSYHLLFKILIQSRPSNWDVQVSQILDHIEKVESFETPECMFIDLIKFYGENNIFSEGVELFFRVPKLRCELTVEIFNTLLLVLCRNEMGLKIVPEIVMKSKAMNIRIEESSFEILIRALCSIGKVSNAFELLNHMVDEGFVAGRKICSLLLATMCRQLGCDVSVVMGFLEDLKSLGFEPRKDDF